jgi:putative peptidoglycan lipid II flippase
MPSRGPSHRGLISAAAIVGVSLLASRVLGLIRTTVFATLFGTSPDMAAYSAAFRVPDLLYTLISGGALASAFIPVFAGLLEQQREEEAWRVANTVLNTLFVVMSVAAALAFLLAPQLIDQLVPNFTRPEKAETVDLTRIMLVQPVLLGVGGVFAAMQQSYSRFLLPAVGPLLYNLAIIIGTVLFGRHAGVYAAAWSVTIGAFLWFQVQLPGVARESRYYHLEVNWRLPGVREVLRLLGPRVVGLAAFQVMLLITTYLASGFSSDSFNAITYSWALVVLPVNAFGSSVATAVFPLISRQSVAAQASALGQTVRESLRAVLFLTLPSTAGLIILRRPIIDLLYDHGSWTVHSTEATAFALAFYAGGLVPMALIEVMPRVFYAMKDTRTPVMIAVVTVLLDAGLSVALVHVFPHDEGQGALGLATAIAAWIQGIWLFHALHRRLPTIINAAFWRAVNAMALAMLVMAVAVFFAQRAMEYILSSTSTSASTSTPGALAEVVITVGTGVIVYLSVARLLGLPEVQRVASLLRR